MAKISKVIIPVAGLGTRMLPATKAIPKEMLPIAGKPLIQYIVEEIKQAGFNEIILITHSSKSSIEDHFDTSFELEAALDKKIKEAAKKNAKIICLPELFLSPYFCQTENHSKFKLAEKIPGPITNTYCKLAKELSVILMISLF